MAWIVLPLTRRLTGPEANINHAYRFPITVGAELTPVQHMLVLMAAVPLLRAAAPVLKI